MKKTKRLFCIFLSILVFIISIGSRYECKAAVNTFSTQSVTVDGVTINAYVYSEPNLLPDTKQLYWVQNGKVQHALFSDALIVMINKKFGLALSSNYLTQLLSYIESTIWSTGEWIESLFTGGAYAVWNGNAIVGIAMGDLTGYTLSDDLGSNDSVTIPSTQVNVLQEITEYYITVVNPVNPDYINIPTMNKSKYIELGAVDNATLNVANTTDIAFTAKAKGTNKKFQGYFANSYYCFENFNNTIICSSQTSYFDSICQDFNLTLYNNSINFDTWLAQDSMSSLYITGYNKQTNQAIKASLKVFDDNTGALTNNNTNNIQSFVALASSYCPFSNSVSTITVYRELTIPTQITNNVYNQKYYKSNTWNNYNPTNNNEIKITVPQMQGANQGNTTIYNESKTTTNTNTTTNNYQVDNSTNDNSVTTIINNYYGDNSGGGGDDDDDDSDDTLWKALLKAIGDFLKKIGELIATILTGLVSILTSVLDAIAAITTNFTGVTTFISSVFGFLPSDVLAVITLGITLGILISLIKMFGK